LGLSVAQLVHVENGNLFAFESNLENIINYSKVYARALNFNSNALDEPSSLVPARDFVAPVDSDISHFLIKK
jgi:hypothetical protein